MTDDELKALVAQIAVAQTKTDEQLAKTDAKLSHLVDYMVVSVTIKGALLKNFSNYSAHLSSAIQRLKKTAGPQGHSF